MDRFRPDGKLVHTPPARKREGLRGYILRVSEENGYSSPWHIFSFAEIEQGKRMTTTPPLDRLSEVLGRSESELKRLPWYSYPSGVPIPPLNAGMPRFLRLLSPRHPRICPRCVEEEGTLDVAWDLRHMLVCPFHRIPLIDHCPACRQPLTWFRPGLRTCKCGHILTALPSDSVRKSTIDLARVIYDALYEQPAETRPESGIPAQHLANMGLELLLNFLDRLAAFLPSCTKAKSGARVNYDLPLLNELSRVFQDWPNRFQELLGTLDPDGSQPSISLTRRFGKFYTQIVRYDGVPREKLLYLRKAFAEYPAHRWGILPTDPRFLLPPSDLKALRDDGISSVRIRMHAPRSEIPSPTVDLTELAQRLGVGRSTARQWAQKGLFGIVETRNFAKSKQLYSLTEALPHQAGVSSLSARQAGKYLGVPLSILKRLRGDGLYAVRHLTTFLAQYHPTDLDAFRERLVARAPSLLIDIPVDGQPLSDCFRLKMRGVENKYQIVKAIIEGRIDPLGRIGQAIGDIVIKRSDLQQLRAELAKSTTMPASSVAHLLGCCPEIFPEMVSRGFLRYSEEEASPQITRESAMSFDSQFVSCARIATALGCLSRRVTRVLRECDVELLTFVRPRSKSPQTFCSRAAAKAIWDTLKMQRSLAVGNENVSPTCLFRNDTA